MGDSVRRVAFLTAVGTLLVLVFAMDASAQDWAPYAPTGGSATEFEPGSVSSDGGILAGLGQMIYNVVAFLLRAVAYAFRGAIEHIMAVLPEEFRPTWAVIASALLWANTYIPVAEVTVMYVLYWQFRAAFYLTKLTLKVIPTIG